MIATKILGWLWPFVVGIVVGYLLGGWAYEVAGDAVMAAPTNVIYHYQTLIVGAAGVGAALIAAHVAWRSVERQINEGRLQAERVEHEAMDAAVDLLIPILGDIAVTWRAADIVIARRLGDTLPDASLLQVTVSEGPDPTSLERLATVGTGLAPARRIKVEVVVQFINVFYRHAIERVKKKVEKGGVLDRWDALAVRTYGSHVEEACRRCDARLLTVFGDLTRSQVH